MYSAFIQSASVLTDVHYEHVDVNMLTDVFTSVCLSSHFTTGTWVHREGGGGGGGGGMCLIICYLWPPRLPRVHE